MLNLFLTFGAVFLAFVLGKRIGVVFALKSIDRALEILGSTYKGIPMTALRISELALEKIKNEKENRKD